MYSHHLGELQYPILGVKGLRKILKWNMSFPPVARYCNIANCNWGDSFGLSCSSVNNDKSTGPLRPGMTFPDLLSTIHYKNKRLLFFKI